MAYFFSQIYLLFFLFLTFCWPLDTIAPPTITIPKYFAYQEIKHDCCLKQDEEYTKT